MDSYSDRVASPGTERILVDFYNTDDDTTTASVTTTKRKEKSHNHLNHMARKDLPPAPVRYELVSDKINDKHYASDMIRRTVFTNQNQLNSKEPQNYHNNASITSTSTSESEIAARTSNRQMKGLQHSQSMQTIIQQVMEVHNSVTGTHC